MTIRDCPKCGGTHFGSLTCPMQDPPGTHAPKPQAAPSPSMDVVREWEEARNTGGFNESVRGRLRAVGDRMAAALTDLNRKFHHEFIVAEDHIQKFNSLTAPLREILGLIEEATPKQIIEHAGNWKADALRLHREKMDALERATAAESQLAIQAKRIEGLEKLDAEHISARASQNRVIGEECEKRRAAEATIAELRAELNAALPMIGARQQALEAVEVEVERLTKTQG